MSEQFYVDNLIISGKDLDKLNEMYEVCTQRMDEEGFVLRSWGSNGHILEKKMKSDSRLNDHERVERVLGYNREEDTVTLADFDLDLFANTKRKVLAQT